MPHQVGAILRQFGPGPANVPPGPAVPTFTVTDNGDGTGGVVTVVGSSVGATNTFYAALRYSASDTLTFSAGNSRMSDGTIVTALPIGNYWGYIHSVLNGQAALSLINGFTLTTDVGQTPNDFYCEARCDVDCSWIFERIFIWPQFAAGSTRVEWVLHPNFTDTGPYTFQLQVGGTGSNDADDWADVGAPVIDTYFALDSIRRAYGKFQWTHYRIKLVTSAGEYFSTPQPCLGNLGFQDWARARELVRLETLRLKKEAGQEGYLLKRKLFGEVCTCVDAETGEVKNPQHLDCYGTGFVGGYYDPYSCVYVEQSVRAHRSHIDAAQRGTVDDLPVVNGRMLNVPQVFSYDVWVDRDTDLRWAIHKIQNIVEIRGVPLVVSAEMRLLPFTDIVYQYDIDGQVPT
jgi:hypothetical protein